MTSHRSSTFAHHRPGLDRPRPASAFSVVGLDPLSVVAIVAGARHWSFVLLRWGAIRADEIDDLHQDLIVHLLERWPQFDSTRSGARTFADRAARSGAIDLRRRREAGRRGSAFTFVSWDEQVHGRTQVHPSLRLDVHRLLDRLSEDERRVCEVLVVYPVAAAARELGLTRASLRRRITKLREIFDAAGLRAHLEAA